VRFSIDSNVLVYAADSGASTKHVIAMALMNRAAELDAVLCTQVLGEFLAVVRRKLPEQFTAAAEQAERWATLFPTIDTASQNLIDGAALALRYQLQFWDSVILETARSAGAEVLLSEDMANGVTIAGVMLVNPFAAGNHQLLDILLER